MSTSRFGAVVDALVTACGTTSAGAVFDGPANTADIPTSYIVVGGTEDPDDEIGEVDQDWAGIGAKAKNETGAITCAVLVSSGDDSVKAARDQALTIFGQVESAVRADPSLGGVVTSGWLNISAATLTQRRNANGLYARARFTVSYQARI